MQEENVYGNGIFTIVKGLVCALAAALLLAVIFASILQASPLPDSVIYPVNQVIKGVSIALGTVLFVRGDKGWLKGGAVGLLFTALSYLGFSALGGDFSLSWLILLELVIALLIGAVGGAVGVNLRER